MGRAGRMEKPAVSNIRETGMLSTQGRDLLSRMFDEFMKDRLPLWLRKSPIPPDGACLPVHAVLEIEDEDDDGFTSLIVRLCLEL
jgi:hypothetical protein